MLFNVKEASNLMGLSKKEVFNILTIPSKSRHDLQAVHIIDTKKCELPQIPVERMQELALCLDKAKTHFEGDRKKVRAWFNTSKKASKKSQARRPNRLIREDYSNGISLMRKSFSN